MRPYQKPNAAEHRALRDWLESKGMTRAQSALAIGTAVQSRAMGEIADGLRATLKVLPKKV